MANWVLDRLLRVGGLEVLWPDATGTLLEMGFNYSDLTRVMGGVGSLAQMSPAWLKAGLRHEARAQEEEAAGHAVTAAETYFRAVGCFGRARWGMFGDSAEKARLYDRLNGAYDRVIALGAARIERVEVPVEGGSVPGLLHLPATAGPQDRVPAVILFPGMDMTKEYFPVPNRNVFTDRGMAVLALDPPGHGFSNIRGLKMSARNVEASGVAAFDLLAGRAEIDPARIGIFGIGTGGYFALSAAAEEHRFAFAVGVEGGFFYDSAAMLDREPPSRKERLRYMSDTSAQEIGSFATRLTIEGREGSIVCPKLFVIGEWDELTPQPQVALLASRLQSPARIRTYLDEGHVLGGVIQEALRFCVDWIADVLEGRVDPEVIVESV